MSVVLHAHIAMFSCSVHYQTYRNKSSDLDRSWSITSVDYLMKLMLDW